MSSERADPWTLLRRIGVPMNLPANIELARQGEPGLSLFMLECGRLDVVRRVPGDVEVLVDVLEVGAIFGETAVLDGGVRSATLRTSLPSRVWQVERQVFEHTVTHGGPEGHALLGSVRDSLDGRIACVRRALLSHPPAAQAAPTVADLDWQTWPPGPRAIRAWAPTHSRIDAGTEVWPAVDCAVVPAGSLLAVYPDDPLLLIASGALTVAHASPCNLPVHGPGQFLDALGASAPAPLIWRARSMTRLLRLPNSTGAAPTRWCVPLLYTLARYRADLLRRCTGRLMHARTHAMSTRHDSTSPNRHA